MHAYIFSYLIVDYERLNFSVLQNKWSRDSTPQIVPISTTNNRNSVVNESDSSTNDGKAISSHKMTAGKIADITVAAFLICAIATKVAGFYFNHRRRRRKEEQPVDSKVVQARDPLEELDTSSKPSPEADSSSVNLRMHVLNGEEYNPVNSIQLYVENLTRYAWDWWPLRPSFRELLKNEIRIQWYCVSHRGR